MRIVSSFHLSKPSPLPILSNWKRSAVDLAEAGDLKKNGHSMLKKLVKTLAMKFDHFSPILLGERILVSEYDDLHKFIWEEEKNCEKIHVMHPLVLAYELLI